MANSIDLEGSQKSSFRLSSIHGGIDEHLSINVDWGWLGFWPQKLWSIQSLEATQKAAFLYLL